MKNALIDLVFAAPSIWDKSHKQHHNNYVLVKEWNKIAAQLGVKEKEAKTVWKNLRQEFGKQMRKLEERSGDRATEGIVCSWPFFEKLQFLKDQFAPRTSTWTWTARQDHEVSFNPGKNDDNVSKQSEEPDEDHKVQVYTPDETDGNTSYFRNPSSSQRCDTPQSSSSQDSASGESFTRTRYRKRSAPFEREKRLAKRKRATEGVNDEDVGFFNSLMPTVKRLPPKEKFVFRMKVQQVLYELAFKETAPVPVQPAPNPLDSNPPASVQTSSDTENKFKICNPSP